MIEHDGARYILVLTLLGSMPARLFRASVGSVQRYRHEITRGLDCLFLGI